MNGRLENESAKAFAGFQAYCEMGGNRSLKAVGRALGKSEGLLERWSARFKWVARAKAYDERLLSIQRDAEKKTIEAKANSWASRQTALREDEWQTADQLISRARQMLDWPLEHTVTKDGKTTILPTKWTISDAVRMVEVAAKLRRMAVGEETDHLKVSTPGPDFSKLTVEEVRTYREILIKGGIKGTDPNASKRVCGSI